jgi:hypothetical protein
MEELHKSLVELCLSESNSLCQSAWNLNDSLFMPCDVLNMSRSRIMNKGGPCSILKQRYKNRGNKFIHSSTLSY